MIGRSAVALAGAAGAIALCLAACDPHTAPTRPVTAVQSSGDGGDVAYSAECDGRSAVHVHPGTPAAQAAADKACARADEAIKTAPWPSGVHPLG
ncbi:MAG: hypothetical protein JO285_09445 [Kutzneria sp.]|nr:hypothetical protein [Kutzneria sp.]